MRNLVWRVRQRVGDGSALTAVLATSLLDYGARCLVAGANPVMLEKGIRRGVRVAVDALTQMSHAVKNENELIAIAQAVTMQTDLSLVIGEMFDLLGEHGHITIEKYIAPYLERTYLNGGLWKAGLISPYLITAAATQRAILEEARVLIYGDDITHAADLEALFEMVKNEFQVTKKPFHLLLCARNIKDEALNTLVTAHVNAKAQKNPAFQLIGASFKRPGEKMVADMEDLAILTGAEMISPNRGRLLNSVRVVDLGKARRVEATAEELLLSGGNGEADAIRQQIQTFKERLQAFSQDGGLSSKPGDDPIEELSIRLARLTGSAGILKVGAASKTERDVLYEKAEKGIKAVKAALQEGVVPGGGAAYLHCLEAVETLDAEHPEEKMGIQAVVQALQAPFLTILKNCAVDAPAVWLEDLRSQGPGNVYDALQKRIMPARQAGLLDPTMVLRAALETAASGAMLALSTAVIILKRKPQMSYEP
jgi:chaperonin GroEL